MKKPLSRPQIACLLILWIVLCFLVLTSSPRLDGPVILSLLISGALVFIPLYKMLRRK